MPPATNGAYTWPETGVTFVALCSASMGQDWRTQVALPLNLWQLLPWRNYCSLTLATFGNDLDLQLWARESLAWAVQEKLLVLASGGTAAAELPNAHLHNCQARS